MNDRLHILFIATVKIALLLAIVSYGQNDPSELKHFSEVNIGSVPDNTEGHTTSPDLLRIAFVVAKETKAMVVLDGQVGPEYDTILTPIFSPDGKRIAYEAWRRIKWKGIKCLVVVDGHAGPEYDGIIKDTLVFSKDSKHLAYVAEQRNKFIIVVDGKEGPPYDNAHFTFSPDGRRSAYVAEKRNKVIVVVDGNVVSEHEIEPILAQIGGQSIRPPIFSSDGNRLAYAAIFGSGGWRIVVDGQVGPKSYGYIGTPVFSPDGKHLAYFAGYQGRAFVVLDDQAGREYDGLLKGALIFSQNSKRTAYVARKGTKWQVVVDGQPGPEYDGILKSSLIFSKDSKHLAYAAWRGSSYVDKNGDRIFEQGTKWQVVVDGQPGPEYYFVMSSRSIFSPDSKRVAYAVLNVVKDRSVYCVVVDGQTGPEYEAILHAPIFSQDSKHVAYVACQEGNKWVLVINGHSGPEYDGFACNPVESGEGFKAIARRGNVLYRVFWKP